MARVIIKRGTWKCEYCETTNSGGLRECTNCGQPRGENTKFKYNPNGQVITGQAINKKPDWLCNYCGSLNSDRVNECTSCGAVRDSSNKDYHQLREEENRRETDSVDTEVESTDKEVGLTNEEAIALREIPMTITNYRQTAKGYKGTTSYKQAVSTYNEKRSFSFAWLAYIFIVMLVLLMFGVFRPRYVDITVSDVSWKSVVSIQEEQTKLGSGWSLPSDVTLISTAEEFYGYEKVFSHYEYKEVTKSRQVQVGTREVLDYVEDLGNGDFAEHYVDEPIYETEYYTETEEIPVYDDIEIYKTKYYYTYKEWATVRTEFETGGDTTPYYADYKLGNGERKGTSHITYTIKDSDGGSYNIGVEDWNRIDVGDIVTLKKNGFLVDVIFEDEK